MSGMRPFACVAVFRPLSSSSVCVEVEVEVEVCWWEVRIVMFENLRMLTRFRALLCCSAAERGCVLAGWLAGLLM
jgi:hypothetical protein